MNITDVVDSKVVEVENARERTCDTLIMCIVTTLNKGLRSGGGIGDVLRKSSSKVSICAYEKALFTMVYTKRVILKQQN